ncbi:hypothetical protein [Microbacterium sp. SORGH_AS_0862]|uniref:hypothetical protein n=1 Tax=Microbacterium sp. SORGH_AS_0862 TaxID=3041789 RepID=UPI00278E52D1|nr:hypothetical protein [Microbacterium sp. SORGH_AS_0862]MDQ1205029.1 hypothetical protein [Microbacterium sp. SORGH_AS_0862]
MAENRTVKVTLKAEVAAYVANMMRGAQANVGSRQVCDVGRVGHRSRSRSV